MKFHLLLVATALAIPLAANVANAGNASFKIAVDGRIVPTACSLKISEQGFFDNGKVPVRNLSTNRFTLLPPVDRQLQISCDSKTQVALTIRDGNPGLVPFNEEMKFFDSENTGWRWTPAKQYGLKDDGGHAIGSWALCLEPKTFKADGQSLDSIWSETDGAKWIGSAGNFFHDAADWESWSLPGTLVPIAAKEFTGTIRTQVALDRGSQQGVPREIPFSGTAILTLVYL